VGAPRSAKLTWSNRAKRDPSEARTVKDRHSECSEESQRISYQRCRWRLSSTTPKPASRNEDRHPERSEAELKDLHSSPQLRSTGEAGHIHRYSKTNHLATQPTNALLQCKRIQRIEASSQYILLAVQYKRLGRIRSTNMLMPQLPSRSSVIGNKVAMNIRRKK